VRVLQPEHLPQQRLAGHPGQRAHLQPTAMPPTGDGLDESSQQGPHQIRGQRIGGRLTAANHHIGQQRQPQRMAMGQLDQLVVAGGIHATGVQVLAALLRAQIAQRHHPQQLPPGRVDTPGRPRRSPSGDHRQGRGRQPRQQPGAHPVIQWSQPLIGVEQDHQSAAVGQPQDGAVPLGHLKHPQRLEHDRRRRDEVAPVQTNHARARVSRKPSIDVQQPRLADAWWSVDVEQQKRRLGRLERDPKQLDLRCAADEPAPPARRQQVTKRAGRPHLGHSGRIGAEVHVDQPMGSEPPDQPRQLRKQHEGQRGRLWASRLTCLIIRLIIQTIRRDPSRSDQIDDPSNVGRPDPSGADQIDAEHQATDLAVGVDAHVLSLDRPRRPGLVGGAAWVRTSPQP
jgi:hypothetical protein